ncbi:MAG: hypothetical protein HY815_28660 [Candidatus Riflebacteria bacterium]|nr:hypothetical protein [Candidatus Riflebacteria bacterium]
MKLRRICPASTPGVRTPPIPLLKCPTPEQTHPTKLTLDLGKTFTISLVIRI